MFMPINEKFHLGKLDPNADGIIFLGYSLVGKSYKVFNKSSLIVEVSINMVFDESNRSIETRIDDEDDTKITHGI